MTEPEYTMVDMSQIVEPELQLVVPDGQKRGFAAMKRLDAREGLRGLQSVLRWQRLQRRRARPNDNEECGLSTG